MDETQVILDPDQYSPEIFEQPSKAVNKSTSSYFLWIIIILIIITAAGLFYYFYSKKPQSSRSSKCQELFKSLSSELKASTSCVYGRRLIYPDYTGPVFSAKNVDGETADVFADFDDKNYVKTLNGKRVELAKWLKAEEGTFISYYNQVSDSSCPPLGVWRRDEKNLTISGITIKTQLSNFIYTPSPPDNTTIAIATNFYKFKTGTNVICPTNSPCHNLITWLKGDAYQTPSTGYGFLSSDGDNLDKLFMRHNPSATTWPLQESWKLDDDKAVNFVTSYDSSAVSDDSLLNGKKLNVTPGLPRGGAIFFLYWPENGIYGFRSALIFENVSSYDDKIILDKICADS